MKINILANRLTWTAVDGTDTRINRVNLAADNGATGRLIWSHTNDAPKFLGENMDETQLKAGKECAAQINLSRLNKTASTFDIYRTLTEAGWCTITPA